MPASLSPATAPPPGTAALQDLDRSVRERGRLNRSELLVKSLAAGLRAEVVETHISWVLLAGTDAWKIKKPIRTAFLDYGTVERRRTFCEEEIRLNGRLSEGLYLGVVAITGSPAAPVLGGRGIAIEHAVHMRRFEQSALFSQRLAAGVLEPADIDAMGDLLGRFHATAATAPPRQRFGNPSQRRYPALAALSASQPAFSPPRHRELQAWMEDEAARLAPLWRSRCAHGAVRDCHGDLHLDNLLRLPGGVAAFDGIEFDPALRYIDVIDDIAFPFMDLLDHERPDFAYRLLNRWLDRTGEHGGVPSLRFAAVYRALVRAQVALLRGKLHRATAAQYAKTALALTRTPPPQLTIMHGLPGSGKTFVSQQLLERQGAIRIRSDVERKRLFGLGMLDASAEAGLDIYGPEATERTYAQLLARGGWCLDAGFPVVLDAAFLGRRERELARALAHRHGAQFVIADCAAPEPVRRRRLQERVGDASEAGPEVGQALAATAEPLAAQELGFVQPFGDA
jgi:uncharacterized protein